jgi:cytochrome c553
MTETPAATAGVFHVLIVMMSAVLLLALAAAPDLFEAKVRPVLAAKCQACHSPALKSGGLDLTSAKGFQQGRGAQRMLAAISHEGAIKMPPAGKLPAAELAALREWIAGGAAWPDGATVAPASSKHWAFQPLKAVKAAGIDELLRIPAAPKADRLTLLRRVTFDLTGLPPTEQELQSSEPFDQAVDRLLASPRYGEKWGRHWLDVARYADSTGADEDHRYPHAWRYRDYVIDAFNRDVPYDQFIREQIAGDVLPGAGPRGIVATGFLALGPKLIAEQDKPKMFYDIVDEQIEVTGKAFLGLTIACARCHDHKFDPISTKDYYSLASIFASTKQLAKLEGTVSQLYFAPLVTGDVWAVYEAHQKKIEAKQKEIDGVIGRENAGYREQMAPRLAEYMVAAYGIYSLGKNAPAALDRDALQRWVEYLKPNKERRPQLDQFHKATPETVEAVARSYQEEYLATAKLRREAKDKTFLAGDDRFYTEVNAAKGPLALPEAALQEQLQPLRAELAELKKAGPPEPPMACGVAEGDPVEQRVFIRGNPAAKGDLVAKQFPVVLAGAGQQPVTRGSGRLELANWIASKDNPLTARVMVNRIWQWHFGEGLVRTPSNFGKAGEAPTNPELLDWLAARFMESGWSVKAMHRLILSSSAYQRAAGLRRRLEVEEIRDSLLAMDGSLDYAVGGSLQSGTGTDKEFSEDRKSISPETNLRRMVYLPLRRSNLPGLLNLFDFGDATTTGEGRTQTNVAPQALYMMNSQFVEQRARGLETKFAPLEPPRRVQKAYWLIVNRPAARDEVAAALSYISGFPGDKRLAWVSYYRTLLASNEFLYVQ